MIMFGSSWLAFGSQPDLARVVGGSALGFGIRRS
jgi:hypothetical protein